VTITQVRVERDERMAHIASAPARRRRAACAAAALVTLLVGWLTAHAVHDPLEQGAGIMAFGVAEEGFTLEPQQEVTNAFGTELRVVTPAVGSRLGIAFGLTNTGPVDVEILDVGFPFPDYYLADPQPFTSAAAGGSGLPYVAMEPFVLSPGEHRDVGMTFKMAGCPTGPVGRSAGALIADRVPVTWRWLGRTHVTDVPLGFRGALEGLPGCAGP
jgi:hypothetical protein